MKPQQYKVIVVDDYRISRTFFEMMVKSDTQYELLSSFSDADTALKYCRENKVDLVVMDILMRSGTDGLSIARQIKAERPEIKIILATSALESTWEDRAREAGIESFWYKEYSKEPLLEVMNRTMSGESLYPDAPIDVGFGVAKKSDLTPRDLDVLREMVRGLTTEEIAEHLEISVNTVRTHILHMLNKTGFKNRLELVSHASSAGIVVSSQHTTRMES